LCSMFQVCFRFDPESCHEFKLQTKRRGEEETHEEDKTRQDKARQREGVEERRQREERSLFLSPSGRHRRRCDQSRRMSRIDWRFARRHLGNRCTHCSRIEPRNLPFITPFKYEQIHNPRGSTCNITSPATATDTERGFSWSAVNCASTCAGSSFHATRAGSSGLITTRYKSTRYFVKTWS